MYKWVDKQGTMHFTDNFQNIPEQYRNKAKDMELPEISTYEDTKGTYSGGEATSSDTISDTTSTGRGKEVRKLELEINTLKSQISAKKDLIKSVDDRKNLALNPLRNRVVDPQELELYEKYKNELPDDNSRLEEYEELLERLKE